MSNQDPVLLIDKQGSIINLILNRTEVRNALNPELIGALIENLKTAAADPNIRLIIIRANGEHFCSGADINWMRESIKFSEQENKQDAAIFAELLYTLNTATKPTLSITQGAVYGGALGIVACCDITIAANTSVFCFSEVKLGLAPAVISPYVVSAIGVKAARRWLLSGETFNALIAEQLGLVHQVVANTKELNAAVDHFSALINQAGPHAIAATKALLLEDLHYNSEETVDKTTNLIAKLRTSAEGQEGLKAFLEKRAPKWCS
jgi:methylglutaconyl-CoA hydratase